MTKDELRKYLRSGSTDARPLLEHIVTHTSDKTTRDQVDRFLDTLEGED